MEREPGADFYAVQRRQSRTSALLLIPLFLFYFLAFFLAASVCLVFVNLLVGGGAGSALSAQFLSLNFFAALLVALIHFYDARKLGARFIRERLEAKPPDPTDRYHRRFSNLVEEMRIAAGLPRVDCYVLPSLAINSLALVEAEGTPSVLVTEGLLADCTREELQAAVAHELAHILRGDAFYVGLVCSLANLFERVRQAVEPASAHSSAAAEEQQSYALQLLLGGMVSVSELIMLLLSTLMTRQREILADATAVQLCRNPMALARVIYKAHLKRSFIGDFSSTYGPLLIVPPESEGAGGQEGFWAKLFSSHPPLSKRMELLGGMADTSAAAIVEQVWQIQQRREDAKGRLRSFEALPVQAGGETVEPETEPHEVARPWMALDPEGEWQGPLSLEELLVLPDFSPLMILRNLNGGIEAKARTFGQVHRAMGDLYRSGPVDAKRKGRCPRCESALAELDYEGVPLRACPGCGGKLVGTRRVERILARREVAFSRDLHEKAQRFKERFFVNPLRMKEIEREQPNLFCPNCGTKMLSRPYSYAYFVPVDKCLACQHIWFDADELEMLQILIEEKQASF